VRTISLVADTLAGSAVSGLFYTERGGSLWVGHAGVWGGSNDTYSNHYGMYALDGGQQITVEKISNVVSLTATPSRVRANTRVAFTAVTADSTIPWHIGSWEFTPDAGTYYNPPCYAYQNPCTIGVGSSGTMKVNAWSGNAPFTAVAHVTVYSTFTLEADKTSLVSGDSVTFTPKLDGVKSKVARWVWRGDDASVITAPCAPETDTCVRTPPASGTMWAYTAASGGDSASKHVTVEPPKLTLTASPTSLTAGDSSTFTVTANGAPLEVQGWAFRVDSGGGPGAMVGTGWRNCQPGMTQCTSPITASGTVIVLGTVRGISSKDSVHLSVTSGCASGDRIATGGKFLPSRSSDCLPGGEDPPETGGDVGSEDGTDCASIDSLALDSLMLGYFPAPAATLALLSDEERHGGPSAGDEEVTILCALDTCTRDASVDEGLAILNYAYGRGEWTYTQNGAKGGVEPPRNTELKFGDCTDLTWDATKALGPGWPHGWNQKISTRMFDTLSATVLASVGYRQVPVDSARAGDIVVRGGHAGVYGGDWGPSTPGVWGWANNGSPAYPDPSRPNVDRDTGWFNFETKIVNGVPIAPKFFRPLVLTECP